jgi:PAS domain S-box-containing protein
MDALRTSDQQLEVISNALPALLSYIGRDLRYHTCNDSYLKWFGLSREEIIGKPVREILGEEAWSAVGPHMEAALAGEKVDYESEVNYQRGGKRWIHAVYTPHRDPQDQVLGLVVMVTDITGRRRQELELAHRSRQQALMYELAETVNRAEALDDLYEKALDVITASLNADRGSILLFDADGVMRFKAWRNLSEGYRQAVEGHSPWTKDERSPKPILIGNVADADLDPPLAEVVGREGIQALSFIPLTCGGRLIGKFMVYFDRPYAMSEEDLTLAQAIAGTLAIGIERKMAEAQLRQHQDQLQAFANQLEQLVDERTQELVHSRDHLRALATELNLAEQRERKRVAAELHDYLAQLLVLAKMKLGQGKRLVNKIPACADFIRESEDALSEALTYTRTLVADLSPPVLHDFGLPTALCWLGQQMERHQLKVAVRVGPDVHAKLPTDQALLVFQSVRELLMNIAKHSGSGEACLSLNQSENYLRIEVRDEGKGFTVTPQTGPSTKFGLFSIRERMRALGGTFDIESAPGKGTTATLTLPLQVDGTAEFENLESGMDTDHSAKSPARRYDPSTFPLQHAASYQQGAKPIRVLLVDDHAMVRQGLRSVLDDYADIEVVGEASHGDEAITMTERLRPSLVLMDVNMPKMSGVEATARIKTRHPEVVIIGLSVQAGYESHLAMLKAGATRLLTKEAAVDQLHHAILHALNRTAADI